MVEKMVKLQDKKTESSTAAVSQKSLQMVHLEHNSEEHLPLNGQKQISYQKSHEKSGTLLSDQQPLLSAQSSFDEGTDFFAVINKEMDKINKFYVGKLAALRISLEEILNERKNTYRSHHTSSNTSYLLRLRDNYIDLKALINYSGLNRTAFYKIIKKYDKVFNEKNLDPWLVTVDKQAFCNVTEPNQLLEIVTGLVSRDKLLEWERFESERQNKSLDEIFPSVRLNGILISVGLFLITLCLPNVIASDPAASRCLSLLLFVIFMWITEAIPYFATALLIPILVTLMGVLKDPKDSSRLMNAEEASQFVMNSIFNHTTMLLLGGYTISTGFSRCQLELRVAAKLQKYCGSTPKLFILAVMFLGLFLSMWISNHTAPILCAAIILPIVRDLPTDSR
jgi:phosphate transporter